MKRIDFKDQHDYGFEVPPRSRKELVGYAHALHQSLGYIGNGPFPILKLVEYVFPLMYNDYTFEVVPDSAMGDNLGQTWPDKHRILIREDVYNAAANGQGLARMTVAHESAHLLLHENIPVAMARRKMSKESPAYKSSEWQANALGGCILMPASKIINMSTEDISEIYNVSLSAAEMQRKAIRKEMKRYPLPAL